MIFAANIPIDPIVTLIHDKLFLHRKIERKVEHSKKEDSSTSSKVHKYENQLANSLYARVIMQLGATLGPIITTSFGLFCTHYLYHMDHTNSYYACLLFCILFGYIVGMLLGALCSPQAIEVFNELKFSPYARQQ